MAKNEYLMRHDRVGAHVHNSIYKALDIERTDKWHTHTHTYTHTAKSVYEHEDVSVMESRGTHLHSCGK